MHAASNRALTAEYCFRLGRVLGLVFLVVLPLAAVTSAREIAFLGAGLALITYLCLGRDGGFHFTPLAPALAAYALTAVVSLFFAVDLAYSLEKLNGEIIKGLGAFYLGVHLARHPRYLRQAWGALLAGALVMVLAGPPLFFYSGGSLANHVVRAGSLHSGYGTLATYLVTVWPYLLLAPLAFPSPRLKPLWLLALAATLATAYLTYGRASWAAILLETGLVAMIMARKRLRVLLLGLAGLVLVIPILFALPGSQHGERWEKLLHNPAQLGGTGGDLLSVWSFSLDQLAGRPFRPLGVGRGSFIKAFPHFKEAHSPLLWHNHNMFLDQAMQLGVQGLLALLWILGSLALWLWPSQPPARGDPARAFRAATWVMLVGFCLRNMTDDFFVNDSALLFWLLAGLALGDRWRRQGLEPGEAAS